MTASRSPQVNLKRLVEKEEVSYLIREAVGFVENAVTILDSGGRVILGSLEEDSPLRYSIKVEDEVIGWVRGGEKASVVALALSCLAGAEMEKKSLGRETLEKYKEITLLYNITEMLATNLDPKEIAQLVIIEAKKLINADNISVMLVNYDEGMLETFAASGQETHPKTGFKFGEGIAGNVAITGLAEIVNNVRNDSRYVQRSGMITSMICSPLKIKDKIIGVVNVSTREPAHYTSGDLKLLSALTLQSAAAIENARLFTNLEKSLEQEKKARQEQLELSTAYSRFVPHEFLRYLNKESIIDVQLGDQALIEATVLFSDIRSFTSLSEKMSPKENFKFINSYLEKMEPIVNNHHGFIDKYIGDGIMALFKREADDALLAAIAMFRALVEYNGGRQRAGYEPIQIGIGINTGPMILGVIGGYNRMDGTVISDTVNLGSRIEESNKLYGSKLLISDRTYKSLRNPSKYHIRAIGMVKAKGKSEYVLVHEVFEVDPPEIRAAKLETKDDFERACILFQEQKIDHVDNTLKAMKLFEKCLAKNPHDKIAGIYIERCQNALKYGKQ